MNVPQQRKLVTEIPGPKSQEIIKRRSEAVSASLGMALPAVVTHASGGIWLDVDGNQIIDMGSGIAVVNVGNSALFFLNFPGVSSFNCSQTSTYPS